MNTTFKGVAVVLAAVGTIAVPTAAAEGEFSVNAAVTSDYVWRGISQSDESPALQVGADYASESGFYVGAWASNIDFGAGSDASVEVDLYGGFGGDLGGGLSFDVGYIQYLYPGTDGEELDFGEIYGGLGFESEEGFGVGGYVYYDFDNENIYIEGTASYAFTDSFGADVSLGNYSFEGGGDYTAYSVGGTYSYESFDFDLRYWSTDVEPEFSITEDRIVLTVGTAFAFGG